MLGVACVTVLLPMLPRCLPKYAHMHLLHLENYVSSMQACERKGVLQLIDMRMQTSLFVVYSSESHLGQVWHDDVHQLSFGNCILQQK